MDVQSFDRADLPEGGPRRFSLLGAFEQVLHEHPGVWFRYPKVGAARLARSRERRCPDTEWRYSAAGPGQFHLYARSVRES